MNGRFAFLTQVKKQKKIRYGKKFTMCQREKRKCIHEKKRQLQGLTIYFVKQVTCLPCVAGKKFLAWAKRAHFCRFSVVAVPLYRGYGNGKGKGNFFEHGKRAREFNFFSFERGRR